MITIIQIQKKTLKISVKHQYQKLSVLYQYKKFKFRSKFIIDEFSSIQKNKVYIIKMYKSPKYKSIEVNSVKDRQKYFKNLYDQVNKSRMAVETIISFKNTQMNFKKKIDQIQQQLHSSMSRINQQTKKNVILKQLITLMKGQMVDFQRTQKKQQQKNQSEAQKKIKKIQYDVEQILQKHNQQIAKITSLKQSASSGRSQRVVFSNLFKKLQKQIKQNQQLYKQNLIRSQIARDKAKTSRSVCKNIEKYNNQDQIVNNRHSQTNIDIFPIESGFSPASDHETAFITLQRQRSFQGQSKKDKRNNTQKQLHCNNRQLNYSQVYDYKNSSRGFSQMISCYQNFLQKIRVHIGCDQIQHTTNYYQTIQLSNDNLVSQIQYFSQQISKLQHCIRGISQQKRHSQCYQYSKELPLGSFRRLKIPTQTDHEDQESSIEDIMDIINLLSKQVGLNIPENQFNEDRLKDLDAKLDILLEDEKINGQTFCSEAVNENRATTATSEANAVDILLQKMQKFSQCQKLLDKNLFKQQYLKQINKNKKHKTKK